MNGRRSWFIVDGYRPFSRPTAEAVYEGHECIMVLNCNEQDAHALIDIYYENKDPVEGIPLTIPAKRIVAFRSTDKDKLGGVELHVNEQYSLRIRSDVDIVVQYGRCDVAQPNLAYLAVMGFAE